MEHITTIFSSSREVAIRKAAARPGENGSFTEEWEARLHLRHHQVVLSLVHHLLQVVDLLLHRLLPEDRDLRHPLEGLLPHHLLVQRAPSHGLHHLLGVGNDQPPGEQKSSPSRQ